VVTASSTVPPGVATRSVMQVDVDTAGNIRHIYVVSATPKLSALNEALARRSV
jgi:hypothetical protein